MSFGCEDAGHFLSEPNGGDGESARGGRGRERARERAREGGREGLTIYEKAPGDMTINRTSGFTLHAFIPIYYYILRHTWTDAET